MARSGQMSAMRHRRATTETPMGGEAGGRGGRLRGAALKRGVRMLKPPATPRWVALAARDAPGRRKRARQRLP